MLAERELTQEPTPKSPAKAANFAALLDDYDYESPQRGQILDSVVLKSSNREIILDVGLKRDALVSQRDLDTMDEDLRDRLQPGEEIKAWVIKPYDYDGDLIVSINRALELEDWSRAQRLLENGEVVESPVIGSNKGGILVQFGRLRGFVPNSHIVSIRQLNSRDAKDSLIDNVLQLKVIEVNRARSRLVLSEREGMADMRRKRMVELSIGQVVTGQVVHLVDFGAFIDIGGVDGLLHISKISRHHINHPSDILTVGETVDVVVDDIDLDRERISFNRSALLPNPWDTFADDYTVNDLIRGTVSNVVDFGVFVNITEGVQGLAHVNNMQTLGMSHPRDMFRDGDPILTRITDIDTAQQRVALSIDAVTADEHAAWTQELDSPDDTPNED